MIVAAVDLDLKRRQVARESRSAVFYFLRPVLLAAIMVLILAAGAGAFAGSHFFPAT